MHKLKIQRVQIDWSKCRSCGFCTLINACYSHGCCTGCLSCYWACPYEARLIVESDAELGTVKIVLDGVTVEVPRGLTVAKALELAGFKFAEPGSRRQSLACRTGGCWACVVVINGSPERACITPVKEGMIIETNIEGRTPVRIIHGPEPHTVGGKATPWWEVNYVSYVEAAVWVAGCNLRCPQCQNYHVTYDNTTPPTTPEEAAKLVVSCHKKYKTKGIAISGGEPTLNRAWLVEFFKHTSRYVKPGTRLHLDSNGTLLTPDYIDELVSSGCNNIGIEPKCVRVETYMKITGMSDQELARRYLETAWKAIEYIHEHYSNMVYLGVGLIYNKDLVTLSEIAEAGRKVASIDSKIQVTVLDYFPAFRRMSMKRPTIKEMLEVKKILEEQGLKTVIVQTESGHIGPGDRNMRLARVTS